MVVFTVSFIKQNSSVIARKRPFMVHKYNTKKELERIFVYYSVMFKFLIILRLSLLKNYRKARYCNEVDASKRPKSFPIMCFSDGTNWKTSLTTYFERISSIKNSIYLSHRLSKKP